MSGGVPPALAAWATTPGGRAVLDAVRERGRRGASLEVGTLRVSLDDSARADVGRVLGIRWETSGSGVALGALERALRSAHGLGVRESVEALDGAPLVSRSERRAERDAARGAERAQATDVLTDAGLADDVLAAWFDHPVVPRGGDGSLERTAQQLAAVWRALRAGGPGARLAEVASAVVGDAHALDRSTPLGRAAVLLAALEQGLSYPATPAEWRWAWRAAGVFCDEVSSRVLVLNLPLRGDAPAVAMAGAAPGEPTWLTLRSLAGPVAVPAGTTVFVCENPTVVEAAADRLGTTCAPLVCTDGRPSQAVLDLLRALVAGGAAIRARADFDAAGVGIVENVRSVAPDLLPWRFRPADYAAAGGRVPDTGGAESAAEATAAQVDHDVVLRREHLTNAVHEESILDLLLADLAAEPVTP